MTRYTHWLVTEGRSIRSLKPNERLIPIVLAPKAKASLKDLRQLVEQEIRVRAMIFVPGRATYMAQIKALNQKDIIRQLSDLWVTEVRLSPDGADAAPGEEVVEWVLVFNPQNRTLPNWQGPADGVIPKATPVTIQSRLAMPSRFNIELYMA
jgi:hypothetical protein